MKKQLTFILLGLIISFILIADNAVKIYLKKSWQINEDQVPFNSITSMCEDDRQNIYVLDRKAFKIYKFSAKGKLLLSFGNRGQGPGDFAYPNFITINQKNQLVVCEDMIYISFFTTTGKFIKRIKIQPGFDLRYINDNLYYAWHRKPKILEQILMDGNGNIIKPLYKISQDSFSVGAPDETGRLVSSNFYSDTYTPKFLFSLYNGHTAIGISNQYKILIFEADDKIKKTLCRDLKPGIITESEIPFLIKEIKSKPHLHQSTKKEFIKRIPRHKNYFSKILINDHHLFAFRIHDDVTKTDVPITVDIFSVNGRFLGSDHIKSLPFFISNTFFYFMGTEDELKLSKYMYQWH